LVPMYVLATVSEIRPHNAKIDLPFDDSSSSSGGTLEEHSRFHAASPGRKCK